jgi:hypothetical protein
MLRNNLSWHATSTEESMYRSFGIDIGRSGVKISTPSSDLGIIPAVATPAVPIDDPDEASRASLETVRVRGKNWFFGQTAVVQAAPEPGLHSEFHHTEEYEALVAGAIKTVSRGDPIVIVGGLPSEASADDREMVRQTFYRHAPAGSIIKIIAQPVGALFSAISKDRSLAEMTVAVVDIGRYSTDMTVSRNFRQVQGALKSVPGVRMAADALWTSVRRNLSGTPSFDRLESALRTGTLRHAMREIDVREEVAQAKSILQAEVNRAIHALSTQMKGQIDVVVLAGGGADLIKVDVPFVLAPWGRHAVSRGFALSAEQVARNGG